MEKIGVSEGRRQERLPVPKRPPDGTQVWMAIDISRSKAVYCLRWDGSEQRRLSTPMGIEHVQALLEQYHGCQVHVAYEACGFGYELAWWLQEHGVVATGDCSEPCGTRAGLAGENRSGGRRQAGAQAGEGRAESDLHSESHRARAATDSGARTRNASKSASERRCASAA